VLKSGVTKPTEMQYAAQIPAPTMRGLNKNKISCYEPQAELF
jgi:hypothetical protein